MSNTEPSDPAAQQWSADTYARNARFVAEYGEAVLDWLDPQPDEQILDLGCGDGALTEVLAGRGVRVTGFDASRSLVDAARARGLHIERGDAHALPYQSAFDAVFSNAALHWMLRPDAVIAGVRRALKPGGRFVGEMGGFGNVAAIATALLAVARRRGLDESLAHPWYFPTPEGYAGRLEAAGFRVERIALIPRPTPLPGAMDDWLLTFRAPLFDSAGADRDAALAEATALLAPALRTEDGRWIADYVRLRFAARVTG